FDAAWSMPPGRRREFLAAQAGDEPDLVEEVLGMFDADDDGGFLARMQGVVERERDRSAFRIHPDRIGNYEIVRVLGEGTMGTVYEARQTEPIERSVAIKLVKPGFGSEELIERFHRERQALAMMQHDGIAKVHECGATENGQPFLVMELVSGTPITEFCRQTRLPLDRRLRLVQRLCEAIQHAHQKGVVHRDLKPDNVLVAEKGGRLAIKVVDFGLAKPTTDDLPRATFRTQVGLGGAGTPAYMAPEQLGSNDDVDIRADVHAIGVMLYELLTGSLPLPVEVLMAKGSAGLPGILRDSEAERPSARLLRDAGAHAAIAAECRVSPPALLRALRTDLDWVVMQAIAKDRELRYPTALDLAADLRRHLAHEPVHAGPPTRRYRIAKFARRHRRPLIASGSIAIVVLVAAIFTGLQALELERMVRDFDQLSAGIVLRRLQDRARAADFSDELPANVEPMRQWLDDTAMLLARRDEFESMRARLDAAAIEPSNESGAPLLLRTELARLLGALDELAAERVAVARRLRWASGVAAATAHVRSRRPTWDEVRADLARPDGAYRRGRIEFDDADVVGLAPLWRNPATGLWEFYHLRSAWDGLAEPADVPLPECGDDGAVVVRERTGIVFVLLPAHRWTDQNGRLARVDPFFLARHELTRAQWERLGGSSADFWHDAATLAEDGELLTATMPAESVDWHAATRVLGRHGLLLPTEVQWKFACRAGAQTLWSSGDDPASLAGKANLRDRSAAERHKEWGEEEGFRDGFVRLAPVGSFDCNAFGFHDMHGNVMEWCRDRFSQGGVPRPGDGLRVPPDGAPDDGMIVCGGGYKDVAATASLRAISAQPAKHGYNTVGLRAARPLKARPD
ncbi:MAG: protein kinase, partial [Planctomycetes bacterium]|nr:protein kinase [Planctomycetota bacterium]